MDSIRISREEMFKEIVLVVSRRSSCLKKQVGALLLKDNRIIAIGYNGVLPHEDPETGFDQINNETHTVHAEANIIAFCAKNGIATGGCTLWVTLSPCEKCAELIIQAGIKEVVYLENYRDYTGISKLMKNDIKISYYGDRLQ